MKKDAFKIKKLGKVPVHNPCAGFEPQQQAPQAGQRSETPPCRQGGTGGVRVARFAGTPLGPLGL